MPALVNNSVGSLAGRSGLERTRVWPCRSKYSRNFSRISFPVMIDFQFSMHSEAGELGVLPASQPFHSTKVLRTNKVCPYQIDAIGLATPMSGKSLTCRGKAPHALAVYDRRSKTLKGIKVPDGKSKTSHASEW